MSTKKKAREKINKINKESVHKKVLEMVDTFEEVVSNEKKEKEQSKEYQYWVLQIVDSIENKRIMDEEAKESYAKMIDLYPASKPILDDLIQQVRMFSVYDFEPSRVNFDFSAYIRKIENLVKG